MYYKILNAILNKYLNVYGSINKVKDLKEELRHVGIEGDFDIFPGHDLLIGYDTEDTYHKNCDMYEKDGKGYFEVETLKRIKVYNYYRMIITQDFLYPAVAYRTKDKGEFWFKNHQIHVYNCQTNRAIRFGKSNGYVYSMDLDEFCNDDFFAIRLMTQFDFDETTLFEAIKCYKLIKKQKLNILFDIIEGTEI